MGKQFQPTHAELVQGRHVKVIAFKAEGSVFLNLGRDMEEFLRNLEQFIGPMRNLKRAAGTMRCLLGVDFVRLSLVKISAVKLMLKEMWIPFPA